jgi:Ca2+-binding RTX toxin-like protein
MNPRARTRSFRPAIHGLEDRKVPADVWGGIGGAGVIGHVFDSTVEVNQEADYAGNRYFSVDGSDYDDVVRVLGASPGPGGWVTLQIEQYTNGTRISARTQTFSVGRATMADRITINGKAGNDTVSNSTSLEMTANGGVGNDWLVGGPAADYLYGGDGTNTIEGRGGNDYIVGGGQTDHIYGGDGNDVVFGNAGADYLYGGAGDDRLDGGVGDDVAYGNAGHDVIDGGGGHDRLLGDDGGNSPYVAGRDTIYGGSGSDYLVGDAGDDKLYGDYTTIGNGDHDVILGGLGNDEIWGGPGHDAIHGEAGNDKLHGEEGVDSLYGGDGDDHLDGGYLAYYTPGDSISVPDHLFGGRGRDRFVRHKSFFGFDDNDFFRDYNSAEGDSTENDWHW